MGAGLLMRFAEIQLDRLGQDSFGDLKHVMFHVRSVLLMVQFQSMEYLSQEYSLAALYRAFALDA